MKNTFKRMDKPLLLMTVLFTLFGLLMIFSASNVAAVLRYQTSPYYFFIKQAVFYLVGFICGLFIVRFPTRNYKRLVPLMVIGIIIALVGLFPYGTIINSAQSWYDLGIASIQPSEFAKTIIIIYFGIYFSTKINDNNPYSFLRPIMFGAIITVLVLLQPDLGGAIIIAGLIFLLFLSVPLPKENKSKLFKTIGISLLVFLGVFIIFGKDLFKDSNSTQLKRLNYQNPCSRYTEDTGYQVCNSLIAFSNGGVFGKGLGNSTQKYLYLPESHTDFIFAIVAEELGAVGAIVVLLAYVVILWRILVIAKQSETMRGSIIAYGTFIVFTLHILINILGITGLIPLTGVPLPLLSYGGSYNLNVIILLFLCQRIAVETKIIKNKKQLNEI